LSGITDILSQILACPECGEGLPFEQGQKNNLSCPKCGNIYKEIDNIPVFVEIVEQNDV